MTVQASLTTYLDAVQHVLDYFGAEASEEGRRYARNAVQAAYREFASVRRWSYYYARGRINTNAAQSTGTIAYVHTGGTYERQVTLTDATWPDWATYGQLVVGNIVYEIAERKSSTVLTLAAASNPGADVAAGTAYTLIRDTYPLPVDFVACDALANMTQGLAMAYVHPRDWLGSQRVYHGQSTPYVYTIMHDPNYMGVLAVRLFPPPDQAYPIDFIYQRRPRPLMIEEYITGTVAATLGLDTITGSATAWTSAQAGAAMRFTSSTTQTPTGLSGNNAYSTQRIVMDVTSGTALTVDAVMGETIAAGAKYVISDPLDIEDGAMLTYFLRECEKQARLVRRVKAMPEELQLYQEAMYRAFEADSRSFARRIAGVSGPMLPRMQDMPLGPDVS